MLFPLSTHGRPLYFYSTAERFEERTKWNSNQSHRQVPYLKRSTICSQFPTAQYLKFSPIKTTQFFHFPKSPFIFSKKISAGRNPEEASTEINRKEMGLLDLERHFAFYGAYHSNPVNILIHVIFVWPIVFSALMLFYFTPAIFHLPLTLLGGASPHSFLVLNLGFLLTLIYGAFYFALDKKAGSLAAFLCLICWIGSSFLSYRLGFSLAWKVAVAAQIFCWTGQFIGHGVFEKRAPALLDNLSQAFIMAPFFVLLEALQSFSGYEPYPGFHASVKAKIDAEIQEWREKKQKKLS